MLAAFLFLIVTGSAAKHFDPIEFATTTAYSAKDSCHYDCKMANGKQAYVGAVACPRFIPLGTKIRLDGLLFVCEDRYNKNLTERYDIFMGYGEEAYKQAVKYGVKKRRLQSF